MSHHLPDEEATLSFGASLAPALRDGGFLTLEGDVGAGKTTLTRGLLRALGVEVPITSPTFGLVQEYATASLRIRHVDLYRLRRGDSIDDLELDDDPDGLVIVEWPDRAPDLPDDRLDVRLFEEGEGRRVELVVTGPRHRRLLAGR